MRLLLVLILIALLPLRSWAGDVMAVRMSAQTECHEAQQSVQAAPHLQHRPAADDGKVGHGCDTCASCQACFTVALELPAPPLRASTYAYGIPPWAVTAYTSACIAPDQKPPIS